MKNLSNPFRIKLTKFPLCVLRGPQSISLFPPHDSLWASIIVNKLQGADKSHIELTIDRKKGRYHEKHYTIRIHISKRSQLIRHHPFLLEPPFYLLSKDTLQALHECDLQMRNSSDNQRSLSMNPTLETRVKVSTEYLI